MIPVFELFVPLGMSERRGSERYDFLNPAGRLPQPVFLATLPMARRDYLSTDERIRFDAPPQLSSTQRLIFADLPL